jgi:hypothetical protein
MWMMFCVPQKDPVVLVPRGWPATTAVRMLHDQLLYQLHVQKVHALQLSLGYEGAEAFCELLLQRDAASPTFLSLMLPMDEASFARNGVISTRNQHTLADENPHSFQ